MSSLDLVFLFQSPLGEVVKETPYYWSESQTPLPIQEEFQSPLGEVVKETFWSEYFVDWLQRFNPLSGKW
jgi:hypothetical protein